jgi:hypothetical protein
VGIAGITNSSVPFLFPNPTRGLFHVNVDASARNTIHVYDVLGNLALEQVVFNSKQASLDLSSLADGVYSVNVQNETGTFTQKIILGK